MARLYPMLLFALLVLVVPVESEGQNGELAKLSEVKILVESLLSAEKELGITRGDIKNQVFVFLRGKLPRLRVSKSASPYVYIRVTMSNDKTGYFGAVQLMLSRVVSNKLTGDDIRAYVWESIYIVSSGLGNAPDHVRRILERLLTKFAADWYRDNP